MRMRAKDKLKDNHTWGPKYANDAAILKLYYTRQQGPGSALDPLVASMTPEDIASLLDDMDELTMQ